MKLALKYNIEYYDVHPDYIEKTVTLIAREKYSQGKINIRNTFIGKKVLVVLMSQSLPVSPIGMLRDNNGTEPFFDTLVTEVKCSQASPTQVSGAIFCPASFGKNKVRVYVLNEKSEHSSA